MLGPNHQVIDPRLLSTTTPGNFASVEESFVVRCPDVEVPDLPDFQRLHYSSTEMPRLA